MAIPEQIRKQTEAVQELYKQLETNDAEATGAEDTQAEVEDVQADRTQEAGSQPRPFEHGTEGAKDEEDYVQKYKTLQGMYNAEVPRLHSQNRDLANRVQQLEQLLATMNAQQNQPLTQAQIEKLVTEQDIEEYGDSIEMMRKVSKEELSSAAQRINQLESYIRQMQSQLVPQVQALSQSQAASTEQQFWSALTNMVPNWREINDDQAFQSWLLDVDPLTGISRQTYLEDAQRNLDSRRVSSFFTAWLEMTGQARNAQPNSASSQLEKQVAPGRAKSTGSPVNNSAKVYTPADIKKFFDDVRKGKYVGREAERDKLERDIFSAQQEGRIQSG
jgi:DNA repair exonuclease SbcCD ATPase subunit